GNTVVYVDPVVSSVDQTQSLRELVADMDDGRVALLRILGGSPVYTAAAELEFGARLARVPLRIHLRLYEHAPSQLCPSPVAGTASAPRTVTVRPPAQWGLLASPTADMPATGLDLRIVPDSSVYDGRFANNGWLQELPRPLSKLTWDNAAQLSPATAQQLGV